MAAVKKGNSKEYKKKYYDANLEKERASRLAYSKRNKEGRKEYAKKYDSENQDRKTAREALRRATKLKATPKWLSEEQKEEINEIYKKAKELELKTNIKHHVDHIVPLQGKNVTGLHVPWNLQVLTAEENLSKSNKIV